jgi:ferredoxin-type protein NapF
VSLGPGIAVIALAGALCGYSALLWLDPLAIFSSFFGVFAPTASVASWFAVVGLPLILVLCFFLPGAWCRHVCPLGGLQNLLHTAAQTVATSKLRGRFQQNSTFPRHDDVRRRQWLRRVALGGLIGVVWAFAAKTMRYGLPRPLRPPGACVDDATFLGLCIRCGNCVRACPSHIIEYDTGKSGVAGLLTPVLHFQSNYCREDCVRCMEICPSGALKRHVLAEKQQIRIGFPHVDMQVCLLSEDQECAICRNACPYEAITLVFSESDYILSPVIDFAKCSGCGACAVVCPTKPTQAIQIIPSLELPPC